MKHRMMIATLGVAALLAAGCTDKKQIAELEAANAVLRAENEALHAQLQDHAADKARIEELLQARRTLQAQVQKLHLQVTAKPARKPVSR